jgi:hypothetical protein
MTYHHEIRELKVPFWMLNGKQPIVSMPRNGIHDNFRCAKVLDVGRSKVSLINE